MKMIDEYKDIDISTKTMPELILLVEECLAERKEFNKNHCLFGRKCDGRK